MKRRDLVRHLEAHGCEMLREGGNHTVYVNRGVAKPSSVPRHGRSTTTSRARYVGILRFRRLNGRGDRGQISPGTGRPHSHRHGTVGTANRKGRAVFPGVDSGNVTIRAFSVPCGPFDWPVVLDASPATQRLDVVVPATGRLHVQVSKEAAEGAAESLADRDVRFLINGASGSPSYPSRLSTATRTNAKGFAELCFPAGQEFDVTVEVAGFREALLPRQRIAAGGVATARVALGAEEEP